MIYVQLSHHLGAIDRRQWEHIKSFLPKMRKAILDYNHPSQCWLYLISLCLLCNVSGHCVGGAVSVRGSGCAIVGRMSGGQSRQVTGTLSFWKNIYVDVLFEKKHIHVYIYTYIYIIIIYIYTPWCWGEWMCHCGWNVWPAISSSYRYVIFLKKTYM